MLAMQYNFTLPADYDMSIIRQRIAAKGSLTDDFPGLVFKAYLYGSRDQRRRNARENLYAPFYLWKSNEGMNKFLGGAGFVALTQSFGWPSVKTWSAWPASLSERLAAATCATREIVPIEPHSPLADLQKAETETLWEDMDTRDALGAVSGFEPTTWTMVRIRLWTEWHERFDRTGLLTYDIGHLSIPAHGVTQ